MGPLGVVECHPVFDDPSGLEAVSDLSEIDRLLFQVPNRDLAGRMIFREPLLRSRYTVPYGRSGADTGAYKKQSQPLRTGLVP